MKLSAVSLALAVVVGVPSGVGSGVGLGVLVGSGVGLGVGVGSGVGLGVLVGSGVGVGVVGGLQYGSHGMSSHIGSYLGSASESPESPEANCGKTRTSKATNIKADIMNVNLFKFARSRLSFPAAASDAAYHLARVFIQNITDFSSSW